MSSVGTVAEVGPKNSTKRILKNLMNKMARKPKSSVCLVFNLIITMLMTTTSNIMTVFKQEFIQHCRFKCTKNDMGKSYA